MEENVNVWCSNSKLLTLIGMNLERGESSECEWSGHAQGSDLMTFYLKDDNDNTFEFTAHNSWGPCGSGYCGASWGGIDYKIEEIPMPEGLGLPITHIVEGVHQIRIVQGSVQKSFEDTDYEFDACVELVKTLDGIKVCHSTGNGGCNYYPSGIAWFNEKLFKELD